MYNPHLGVVSEFVSALWEMGVRDVCLSPGSRSTPLAVALSRHGEFSLWVSPDERSAGFFAIGLARMRQGPAVLVCTSGTAAGNYLPAVMEARQGRIPLIVLTADRPPELREVGANQTVDQVRLYGSHVKWFVELPVPGPEADLSDHARAAARRAVAVASAAPRGPVHLNWPFREPLLPPAAIQESQGDGEGFAWFAGSSRLGPEDLSELVRRVEGAQRGLIVCGPQDDREAAESILRLADRLSFPVLADPLSQLRSLSPGALGRDLVVDRYDLLLRAAEDLEDETSREIDRLFAPDLVLRFGRAPTSKVLAGFLRRHAEADQIVVDEAAPWLDPIFTARAVATADPKGFCRDLTGALAPRARGLWPEVWREWNGWAAAKARRELEGFLELFEGRVFSELSQWLPDGVPIFVGNSMPVRDMDSFFSLSGPRRVLGNRGASGIDGVISSAAGAAAAGPGPVVLVVGDLSFYHDLNGLLAVQANRLPLTVILVHNDGGGIFSFLPQASEPDVFPLFAASHGLDFEPCVHMYGGRHRPVNTWGEFRAAVVEGLAGDGLTVVELRTDRDANARMHKELFGSLKAAAREWWRGGTGE